MDWQPKITSPTYEKDKETFDGYVQKLTGMMGRQPDPYAYGDSDQVHYKCAFGQTLDNVYITKAWGSDLVILAVSTDRTPGKATTYSLSVGHAELSVRWIEIGWLPELTDRDFRDAVRCFKEKEKG